MEAKCSECFEFVGADGLIANNRVWHRDHFRCSHCKRQITSEYYVEDGSAICVSCTLVPPIRCHTGVRFLKVELMTECGYAINETYLEAMGHCWHQKCFLCYGCKKPFPSAKYWLLNGQPYDSDCYWGAKLDALCLMKSKF